MVNIRFVALTTSSIIDRVEELNGEVTHEETWHDSVRCCKSKELEVYFPQPNTTDCYTEEGIPVDELADLVDGTEWNVNCTHDYENGGVFFERFFE